MQQVINVVKSLTFLQFTNLYAQSRCRSFFQNTHQRITVDMQRQDSFALTLLRHHACCLAVARLTD